MTARRGRRCRPSPAFSPRGLRPSPCPCRGCGRPGRDPMRKTPRSGLRLFLATGCVFLSAALYADTIYLKNGATIPADAWEIRGDLLVVRQGTGRINVPRSDVLRIEPGGPGAAAQSTPPPSGTPAARPTAAPPIE